MMTERASRGASRGLLAFLLGMAALFAAVPAPSMSAVSANSCPNEAFRTGASMWLPDCRAYELMSPPDTNGRLLESIGTFGFTPSVEIFPTELVSPEAESLVYVAYTSSLREPGEGNGLIDVYKAERSTAGWFTTRRLSPSGTEAVIHPTPGGVSAEHDFTFSMVVPFPGEAGGSLAANGAADYLGKPNGSFELTGRGSLAEEQYAQGRFISAGGEHVIFTTGHDLLQSFLCFRAEAKCKVKPLEPNAPESATGAVYDRSATGPTRVVSLLPGDATPASDQQAFYKGVSEDGATVAFTIGGTLYVRVPDAEDGETLKVAEGEPTFAGLSDDGHYLFYVVGGKSGDIHRFDTSDESDEQVTSTGDGQIVNVSADGSHVYFISKMQINGQGAAGQPNLYVWSGGSSAYITTVAPSDLERTSGGVPEMPALGNWTSKVVAIPEGALEPGPGAESSRATPDGMTLLFESRAKLTSFENADHTEIYRYDDSDKTLVCVSCAPLVEPPSFDAHLQELRLVKPGIVIHNLTDDGSHAFFETAEALVPGDTDGVNDIYEWSKAEGEVALALISSGKSREYPEEIGSGRSSFLPAPNVLFSITPSGSDVAFLSQEVLVASAGVGGAPAIYDARINGGFPESQPSAVCAEEGCRPLGPPAPILAPVPPAMGGTGNVKKSHCRPSHRKKTHGHCGKRKSKKRIAKQSTEVAEPSAVGRVNAQEAPLPRGLLHARAALWSSATTARSATTSASEFESFGIESMSVEESNSEAASHPDFTINFALNHFFDKFGRPKADARLENASFSLPSGFLGYPGVFGQCETGELIAGTCPLDSQVGFARVLIQDLGELGSPIYNLEPPHPDSEVARFGFIGSAFPVYIDIKVRTAGDYGVIATVHNAPGAAPLLVSKAVLWGNPASPSHDAERLPAGGVDYPPVAFMTNPSACQGGEVGVIVTSYQLPGQIFSATAPLEPITGCQGEPFAPSFEAQPTSHIAGAPTGLKTKLSLPQHLGPDEKSTATMYEARVTLPQGMQIAAGAANWIGTCSAEQVGFHEEVDANCPDNSKLGKATITSPALSHPIEGTLYQRTPSSGHQFGLWLVVDALGLHIKLPAELQPDKQSGRLTAVFGDLPQVPVETIDLEVWGGARAPLQNPDHCGTYATDFSFAPHSQDPAISGSSQMTIDQGCNQGFSPSLQVGITNPVAGKYSPLVVDLTRPDGDQALHGFELKLPDGELAKIKGVSLCPDAAAVSGNCPSDTAIGHVTGAAGPGPEPLWVPQAGKAEPKIYLAGSYQGSPFSTVTVVPAQAGPFDLGNIVIRSGLGLDPDTNQGVVKADPLPQFFEGVGLTYRRLRVVVDRPEFSLNPTDCSQLRSTSDVTSTLGAVAHPSAPFQVKDCTALKFKPSLRFSLKGGTKRAAYPALTAVLKARKGDANIGKVTVALPHSEFLAQEHIVTICTRKQFVAGKCPKGSVYGTAKAWTPLLAKPLSGPVYLRSSSHPLPDLVVALGGELDVNLVGRIDSTKSGGIRSTFDAVPDAPVSKFVLRMRGGAKSLFTNSTDVCLRKHRAQVALRGQNGRTLSLRPALEFKGCGGGGQRKPHRSNNR